MPVIRSQLRSATWLINAVALLEILAGAAALRATVIHAAAYTSRTHWLVEITLFSGLVFSGLGLLRRQRWAARVSVVVLRVAFFAVLVILTFAFDEHGGQWWYWVVPLLLPLIGWCIQLLRHEVISQG